MSLDKKIFRELKGHPYVLGLIKKETDRVKHNVELIASENYCSDAVRAACASILSCKYAEGYPDLRRWSGNTGRYYGGCEYIDELEEHCCEMWREVFDTNYHVNVQPHSGSQANSAAYASVLKPGDTILAMSMDAGAHLTHSSPVSFVSEIYNVVTYGLDDNGLIDYEEIEYQIKKYHPKLIIAGASAYSRIIDFEKIHNIIYECYIEDPSYYKYPHFMADISHIAGLVAAGLHPSPFDYADIITTTSHKTLKGIRGGLIFCKPGLAKRVDSAVFPKNQGGPLEHIIAAKAITAEECCTQEYHDYIHNVVKNSKAMCERFKTLGYKVVTDGTENHLFVLDFSDTHPRLTGKMVQDELDKHGITLNKNCVPGEKRSPKETSGVRIGTAAMTTKGWKESDFIREADIIADIIEKFYKEIITNEV